MVVATVGGRRFAFSKDEIERRMCKEEPEPIREHLVEIDGRDYPPKQVLATLTGWDRTTFTTMEAQRVLMRAGFVCRRNGNMAPNGPPVMVTMRKGALGPLDELAIYVGRAEANVSAAESAVVTARQTLAEVNALIQELQNGVKG